MIRKSVKEAPVPPVHTVRIGRSPVAAPSQILLMFALFFLLTMTGAARLGESRETTLQAVGRTLIDDAQWLLPALLAVTLSFYAVMIAQQVTASEISEIRRTRNLLGYAAEAIAAFTALLVFLCVFASVADPALWPRVIGIGTLALIVVLLASHAGAFVIGAPERRIKIAADTLDKAERALADTEPYAMPARMSTGMLLLTPVWAFGLALAVTFWFVISFSLDGITLVFSDGLSVVVGGVVWVSIGLVVSFPARFLFAVRRHEPAFRALTIVGSLLWAGLLVWLLWDLAQVSSSIWVVCTGLTGLFVWLGPYARAIDRLASWSLTRRVSRLRAQLEALRGMYPQVAS
jgi:hypothetical protein